MNRDTFDGLNDLQTRDGNNGVSESCVSLCLLYAI